MTNLFALSNKTVRTKTITIVLAVVAAVIFPQIFHAIGVASGLGPAVGSALLPMQIPVLFVGLAAGPVIGLIAGFLSPIVSYAVSGMPASDILPFIVLELAVYGFAGGMLANRKMPVLAKLIIIQIAGRLARMLLVFGMVYIAGSQTVQVSAAWKMITDGLFGILLQWAWIPLIIYRINGAKKSYE